MATSRRIRNARWLPVAVVLLTLASSSCATGPVSDRATSDLREAPRSDAADRTEATTTTGVAPAPAFAGELSDAAATSAAKGSVRVTTEVSLDGEVVSVLTVARGEGRTARLTEGPGDSSFEALLVGDTTYVRAEDVGPGIEWISMPFEQTYELVGVDPVAILESDPIADFAQLAAETARVPVTEQELVDGRRVAWYRVNTSVAGLVEDLAASGIIPSGAEGPAVSLSNRSTLEFAAGSDGLLGTLRFDVQLALDGRRRQLRLVQTFDEYGVRPTVAAPRPEATTPFDESTGWAPEQQPQRS